MNTQTSIKLLTVGDGAVGKTCLLKSFLDGNFPTEYVPTVMDNFEKIITKNGQTVKLNIWDTAGQENYEFVRKQSYINTDVFLIVFSIDNEDSFENAYEKWYKELREGEYIQVPKILVGNKIDLRNSNEEKIQKKIIPIQRIEKETKKNKEMPYFECSAMTQEGFEFIFGEAIRLGFQYNKQKKNRKLIDEQQKNAKHDELCCLIS